MDDIETILYVSPKSENDIDDIETIHYASWKMENDIDDTETIPDVSPKKENDIANKETIAYASLRRESEHEIDAKIYNESKLETAAEIGKTNWRERKKNYGKWIGTKQDWYSSFKRI